MDSLKEVLTTLDFKIEYYELMIKDDKDALNVLSKDYKNLCAKTRKKITKDY